MKQANPYIKDFDDYENLYKESIKDPKKFFGEMARKNLEWIKDFETTHNDDFVETKWFEGGQINISSNCIDKHLKDNDRLEIVHFIGGG